LRLHLVALPHAHVSRAVTVCAFTTKTAKFLTMMSQRGWEITLYGGEHSQVDPGVDLVTIFTDEEMHEWYGDGDPNMLPIVAGAWSSSDYSYRTINARAAGEIGVRYQDGDIVLLTGGFAMKPLFESLPQALCVEWAAGYDGVMISDKSMQRHPWICFESQAWKHYMYGKWGVDQGRFFDAVIPNFFAPEEWSLAKKKEDYLLFVGRMIERKGVRIAAEIAATVGMPIYFAGSGVRHSSEGLIETHDGLRLEGDVHYVGTVGVEERNKLMGAARALLVPTRYIEPFGAVAVEGPLCGTAAVSTDFGAFVDTVPRELRFNTLAEGVRAVEHAMTLKPKDVRKDALARFSLEAVAPLYEEWFHRLSTLWGRGWYAGT
jgi:glycosyltransferase involved in cell wall biosynthesis